MATSKPSQPKPKVPDLTRCSICNEIINQPKALPCLHTFCLECLREWSKPNKETITCPVMNCKKSTPMPPNGLEGLPGNDFVLSLIASSPHRGRNVPCVCCEETNNDVLARCMDCDGFLCKQGVTAHGKLAFLKSHQVIMLEDIKSGKIGVKQLSDKKQQTCKEHKGQPLWFYCVTCGVLICRDCTVVDHSKPDHNFVTIKSTVSEQRMKIEELVKQNGVIERQVDKALKDATQAHEDVNSNNNKLIADIDMEMEKIVKHVHKICQQERRRLLQQQEETVALWRKKIQLSKETLQSQKVRFQTTRQVADEVLQSGSDSDIASVYKQVSASLEELSKEEVKCVSENIAELPIFKANSKIRSVTTVGELIPLQGQISVEKVKPHISESTWELENTFGDKEGAGKLSMARGISTTPTGDIVVASFSSSVPVKVYSGDGKFKFHLGEQSKDAWDVAVCSDGKFYLSCSGGTPIKIFGSDGQYLSTFATNSPKPDESSLRALTFNAKDHLLVGVVNSKFIRIFNLSGKLITSFKVSIQPYYITATAQSIIIVSPIEQSAFLAFDFSGTLQRTITAPTGVSKWHPQGVCCSINDEILISSDGIPNGIYCFSPTGVYLRCVVQNVHSPDRMTMLQSDEKLAVVASGSCVKIFRRN